MSEVEDLIREHLARHGVVDLTTRTRGEIDWLAGVGPAPGREDDPRGPALGAMLAHKLISCETEVVGLGDRGELVLMATRPVNLCAEDASAALDPFEPGRLFPADDDVPARRSAGRSAGAGARGDRWDGR